MRPFIVLFTWLTATAYAAPAFFDNVYDYSDELAEFYSKVSHYIDDAKDVFTATTTCDPSKIALPAFASGLPSPGNQKPLYVAVGRGTQVSNNYTFRSHIRCMAKVADPTQNYSCATSTADSKPVAIGAVASLYNATCIAASYSDMIDMLPNIAYKLQLPTNSWATLPYANLNLLGHHFFEDSVPIFNLDTTPQRQYGIAYTKKKADLAAPSSAVQGANGAVAWLYLTTTEGTVGDYESVYRVDTAGGSPPKTCENQQSVITVQYAANYYFFGK
ncbi:hypothetical protein ALT_7853 [Aspergillus lentulus]|uniref:Malate dehydrogenase n=1 Tax=Aspergillus lentulus TaxID=293939 RepID=A0AAN4TDN6_ASPLE|nr:hypothetical protein CNMCM6069_001504 [Aspergillus lentulus]KAF4178400.1 hypothetical protein CNMCM8060_004422 [Aspergillus lentulus]KAF4192663.1 hypothetical protein CNMCM8694_000125 [Aspergillus lentulus]GAQ10532.1 hypothetical protein ALT_7853 [Aspergillus lentulus]